MLKSLTFKKNVDRPKKKPKILSLPSEPTGQFLFSSSSISPAHVYLETEQHIALQREFILLEESSLSRSRHEAELHARLIVAQSLLQLDIAAYNHLKSRYYAVLNRPAEVTK